MWTFNGAAVEPEEIRQEDEDEAMLEGAENGVTVHVHVDSEWAKGRERKSTSGGMMMVNGTVWKHWSRTQVSRALSTTEAEYHAVETGAAEGLGMQAMMTDVGRGFVYGRISTQLKRLLREEDCKDQTF